MGKNNELEDVEIQEFRFSEYSMFLPRGKNSLRRDYPEIKEIEAFKKLRDNDLLFCWFYGHEASPFFEISNPRRKSMLCYKYAYVDIECANPPDENKFMIGDFGSAIKDGIQKMETFRLRPRARAVRMMEKTMQHLDDLINTNLNGPEFLNKDDEVDYTKKNQFIAALQKANEMMPVLINRLENGYSVENVKSMKEESDDTTFIDSYFENQD